MLFGSILRKASHLALALDLLQAMLSAGVSSMQRTRPQSGSGRESGSRAVGSVDSDAGSEGEQGREEEEEDDK